MTNSSASTDGLATWQTVPKEPTEEMTKAGYELVCEFVECGKLASPVDIYRAMLAAAPAAPVDGGFAAGIEAAVKCADAQAARLRENGHSAMALQLDYCSEDIRALAPTALQAENERLRAALERHGGHDEHCRWHKFDDEDHDRYPCTCGLDAALRPAT